MYCTISLPALTRSNSFPSLCATSVIIGVTRPARRTRVPLIGQQKLLTHTHPRKVPRSFLFTQVAMANTTEDHTPPQTPREEDGKELKAQDKPLHE